MNLGQFFITGIEGTTLKEFERNEIRDNQIGGVLLFKRNFENVRQLCSLVNDIQNCRKEYPLFICVDQEGGRVQRFKDPFTVIPPMLDVGKLDSPKTVFELHQLMAKELSACGINLNLSPVCDVFSNPKNDVIGDRSFSSDSKIVENLLVGAIRGHRVEGLLTCAKHFPGHGDTLEDTHLEFAVVKKSLKELEEMEFIPFKKAIRSKLEFFMTSHVIAQCFDDKLPVSLSSKAHEYVREKLGYKKIILSDDMEMGAIVDNFSIEESTVLAFQAGTDILEYRTLDKTLESLEVLRSTYGNGTFKEDCFKDKERRILDCKKQFIPVFNKLNPEEVARLFPFSEHLKFQKALLDKISQVRG